MANLKISTQILHESEALIFETYKDAAIVNFCKPLIKQAMEASGSPLF
jgi:hypothetical protein